MRKGLPNWSENLSSFLGKAVDNTARIPFDPHRSVTSTRNLRMLDSNQRPID